MTLPLSGTPPSSAPYPSTPRRILVTGATGRLGTFVCQALSARGHEVRATDRRFRPDFPQPVIVGDLCDEGFVYGVMDGVDALVHLGNHPHPNAGPSRPGLLAENTAMNANVMYAAVDRGIKTIVFASSIQAILRTSGQRGEGPFVMPRFPLDDSLPTDPGTNPYGLSKAFGEQLLSRLAEATPGLSATSLRFPMLPDDTWLERIGRGVPRVWVNWADCLTYLPLPDAAELILRVVERNAPGARTYFPALTFDLVGYDAARLIREQYPGTKLTVPLEALHNLVDDSFAQEFGLELGPRARAVLNEP